MLAGPFILGSLWAVIPQTVGVLTLVVWTHLEDSLLKRKLDGYAGYAKKVRYRLVPGVW
jgi:protein-S-isoprenylcysteine O-methyltransferase Ste14